MILTYQKDNHLYLAYQDFLDKEEKVYKAINAFPGTTPESIKEILKENFFSDTLQRHNKYISSISTYIDDIFKDRTQYFFHLYILPKDLKIIVNDDDIPSEQMGKLERLSVKLFHLYSKVDTNERDVRLFEHDKGKSFLQLEADFYIDKLDNLYNYLLNYKVHHTNKVICSDKVIGTEIDDLNRLEGNPLKNYQFIKVEYQKELITFIYTITSFIKKFRIKVFESTCREEYQLLNKQINKVNNLLLKISSHTNMIDKRIEKDQIGQYLQQNKNKKEIQKNIKIFKLIEAIFYTQLNNSVQFFASVDLPKVFEKIVERKLINYSNELFVGEEDKHQITCFSTGNKDTNLNNINYLVKRNNIRKINQYPDFLIKEDIENNIVYHVLDAKYKVEKDVVNEGDIRQILIYSILFNKEYSQTIENQKNIKKFIIYADTSEVDLDNIDTLTLNSAPIDIFNTAPDILCEDNVLDSYIRYTRIKTLQY